jgi:hypothetical protein
MDNNGHGAVQTGKIVLALEYDLVTHQVTTGGDPMQVSLAQMICDEALRVLGEQRRIAAVVQLQRQMAEQARTQEIARRVGGRGN